jgi:hypothetical protein
MRSLAHGRFEDSVLADFATWRAWIFGTRLTRLSSGLQLQAGTVGKVRPRPSGDLGGGMTIGTAWPFEGKGGAL